MAYMIQQHPQQISTENLAYGVTEVAIMYGGVASGTKIRIIRICGAKFAATPPYQNKNAE